MPGRNLALLNITSLKLETIYLAVRFETSNLKLLILVYLYLYIRCLYCYYLYLLIWIIFSLFSIVIFLIFSLLLSNGKSSSNDSDFESWWYGKIIGILQALICFFKLLVNLTAFLYLKYRYNLNFISIIVNNKHL